jgi:hypothetical protein
MLHSLQKHGQKKWVTTPTCVPTKSNDERNGFNGNWKLSFACVLAFYLAGWQYIPEANKMNPFVMGINSAISVWIGFFVPVHLSRVVWEKHSWKLFFINSGYHLVATIVVALILSYWT